MTNAEKSSKEGLLLVEFVHGDRADPKFQRYTDWSTSQGFGGGAYKSETRMEVSLFRNTGSLDAGGTTSIILPLDGFTDEMSDGRAHSRVSCTVREKTVGPDGTVEFRALFVGDVSNAIRNYQGKPGLIRLDAACWKDEIDVPLGLVAAHQCTWGLGRGGCGFDIAGATEQATLVSIFGQVVTIAGLSAQADRWWHRGSVSFDGLSILVKDWLQGDSFRLIRPPPSTWLNQLVTIEPGCDKSIEKCRTHFSREEDFGGIGFAMPAHSPNFEMS